MELRRTAKSIFDSDVSSESPEYSYTASIKSATVNITVPAAGATPQTAEQVETATSNADYTVTGIVWHEALTAGDRFRAGQVYTATVTLTSKNGKEFQAVPFTPTVASTSSVGDTTTEGTGTGNTVSFTVTFAATKVQSVTAIAVTTQPDKMTYTECKDGILNLEGMVVSETYNDGTTKEITSEDGTAPGHTTVPANEAVLTNPINNGNPVTITHPASQINIDAVSEQISEDVGLKDIEVSVKISEPAADTVRIVEDTANENNYLIVVEPVEFEITCSRGDKTVEVSKFNAYVERMIEIPEGIDPSRITTGIILNADGTFSHVPTVITIIDGKYYAKINSLTNSVYSVIYRPKVFKDVEAHWAKEAVNDMASRLVVSGVGEDRFEPDRDITRAEFAAIAVRALGLMRPGTGKDIFNDVPKDAWYYDAVSIAYEYGLIAGYGRGQFGQMDKVTREQAMTMVARAMKLTGLKVEIKDSEVSSLLANYTDGPAASAYAKTSIAVCLKTGVITGRIGSTIAPRDYITRAEIAVIVQRLLQKSHAFCDYSLCCYLVALIV